VVATNATACAFDYAYTCCSGSKRRQFASVHIRNFDPGFTSIQIDCFPPRLLQDFRRIFMLCRQRLPFSYHM